MFPEKELGHTEDLYAVLVCGPWFIHSYNVLWILIFCGKQRCYLASKGLGRSCKRSAYLHVQFLSLFFCDEIDLTLSLFTDAHTLVPGEQFKENDVFQKSADRGFALSEGGLVQRDVADIVLF